MTTYTFKACDGVTGIPNAFLPQFQSTSISFEMSDVGSIQFQYLKGGVNASALAANRVEIAVFQDGVEMDDGRYTVQSDDQDELDDSGTISYTGVSLINMLKKALVYSADLSITQGVDQVFVAATPGGILKALFDQNAARGTNRVMDRITYASFSNTLDSAGNAWAFTFGEITYTVGVNYLDVMRNMFDNGMIEFKMVGRDLRVYNAGTMGVDKTIIADPIVLRKGRDLVEAPRTSTKEDIAAIALVAGDGGVLAQFIDSSVATAWGEDEVFISQGGISDPTTLAVLSQQAIDQVSQPRVQNTHKIALPNSPYRPYADYRTSDYIYTQRGTTLDRLRIRQLVLDIEAGTTASASMVLNDKFLEHDIAVSRRVDGILGGATSTGSVAIPAGPDPGTDTTIPKNPASLTPSSSVYVDTAGQTHGAVALAWPAVTQNTDLSTIADLDHYEVEYKTDNAANPIIVTSLSPATEYDTYTRKFDRRGKGFGWLGGEGGASSRAASGKDFWLYGDSIIGTADQSGAVGSDYATISNSVVITDSAVATTFTGCWNQGNKLSTNDAFLETTIGNWQADTNCAVVRDTVVFYYGTGSLKITATAAADAVARIAAPPTSSYSVTAFDVFSAQAKVKTLSGTARNVVLSIRWYDASNALLSTTTGTSVAGSTTVWTRHNVKGTAPINAVKATVLVTIKSAAAAQVFNVDQIGFHKGDMSFGSWSDPNRGSGAVALVNPEEIGGAAIAIGSLPGTQFGADDVQVANSKIYGWMPRENATDVFQSIVYVAQWDGTTHAFEGLTLWSTADVVQWGNAGYITAGFLYMLGLDSTDAVTAQDQFLMRVPSATPLTGTKEWWTGTIWSTTRASAAAVYTGLNGYIGALELIGLTYYALVIRSTETGIRLLTSSLVTGPWTDTGIFYQMQNVGSGSVGYFPRIHNQLADPFGASPMSFSVAGSVGGVTQQQDIRLFAPKFLLGPKGIPSAITPVTNWSGIRIIESGVLIDNIGDLNPGENFQARVRAVDFNGNSSIWQNSIAIRLVDDTTPPNQPSDPIISAQFKGVRIEWDGTDFQGGPPPGDWDRMEVHLSEIANFTPGTLTLVDTYKTRLGGVTPVQGLDYGHTYYARFIAIDVRGNRSIPSNAVSSGLEQLVDTTEIGQKLIQGAMIADNAISVRSITVAAFDVSVAPNGGFEVDATNADGSSTGLPYGWSLNIPIGAGAAASIDSATPISGNKSLKLVMAGAADGARWQSQIFPVTQGKLLAASVKVRASRTIANPAFELHVVCATTEAGAGSAPSGTSIWGTSATLTGTTGIQTLELQRIVDANMKFARVFITALNAADGSGWTATFDDVSCRPVGGSAFIADASILNAKIANLAVDDAKIASASVGKLTAGILTADMTVSARIKTANTGARVELNSSGLQAFSSTGAQTVDIAAATGNATITGNFQTDFSTSVNPHLEIKNSGDRTTIFFTDNSGLGTNSAFINSPLDANNDTRLGLNTGEFPYLAAVVSKHRLFLNNQSGIQLESYRVDTGGRIGYGLYMQHTGMEISRTSSTPLYPTYGYIYASDTGGAGMIYYTGSAVHTGGDINVFTDGARVAGYVAGVVTSEIFLDTDTSIWFTGAFTLTNAIGGKTALFCGRWVSPLSTVYTVTYGATLLTAPYVLLDFAHGGSIMTGDIDTTPSTTDFDIRASLATAQTTFYWAFRVH